MNKTLKRISFWGALLGLASMTIVLPTRLIAQDDDDPPTRVARLGYLEGSVSFQPAGETDWVGAVPNRPITTGDQLWADRASRAELQLGSAAIRLSENTSISLLDLDDNTVQVQLSSGTINVRVRRMHPDDDFEIDTPNLAFVISEPGSYRIDASEDGSDTTVTIRAGEGEATGNGQTYSLHAGQVGYFSGTESLDADVEQIGEADQFDTWGDGRDHRYDTSPSARYLSPDVVGFQDLDDNGDWRDDPGYGHVWFPNRVEVGWAPYHEGHWAWIDPWGYTWVDDSSWGYAPFHYGRWVSVGGRWGWIAGPPEVAPVYAPALVVFVGGGGGWGGNVGWFPLGPREVYVPTYPVSRTYMTQINVSNTTVSTTSVTNVYNTTIVNKTTTITNVTYANRTVPGAVTAVPQNAFASAQPVARTAVKVTPQQIAAAPMSARVAVTPTREAVMGAKASTAGHVAAPPAAVASRQVVAKKAPPPPPVSFAKKQQALAAHPGQPVARKELASLRPPAAMHPAVRVAPPAKAATPKTGHPPANAVVRPGPPAGARPSQPAFTARPAQPAPAPAAKPASPAAKQPENRPPTAPANRPEPNRPAAAQPNNHPAMSRPAEAPAHPPAAPPNRPAAQPTHPTAAEPNRPEPNRPPAAQPSRPAEPSHAPAAQPNRPAPNRSEPAARPATPPHPPAAAKPARRRQRRSRRSQKSRKKRSHPANKVGFYSPRHPEFPQGVFLSLRLINSNIQRRRSEYFVR